MPTALRRLSLAVPSWSKPLVTIDSMEYVELSAFSRYLAECKDRLSNNDIIQHSCTVARALYETEYGKDRSLDKLLRALFVAAGSLRSDKQNQQPDLMLRYVEVEKQLAYIASIRFARLRDKARGSVPNNSSR